MLADKIKSLNIETSNDKMVASVVFENTQGSDGERVSADEIREMAKKQGIVFGLRQDLEKIAAEYKPGGKYVIAEGRPPENGSNGTFKYHFDTDAKIPQPKINDDGTVDFHNLGSVLECKQGDVLVTIIPPISGKDGVNVFGEPVYCKTASDREITLPVGENTVVSEDGTSLIATVDGHINKKRGKVSVRASLEISGDVSSATGDVVFSGEVVIKGSVRSGFKVKANKGVHILGVVEGADVESDGDIVIEGGARGGNKARILAGGSVTAKFLESCTVNAKVDISADSILHCSIHCGRCLNVKGKKGMLVGGNITVRDVINANSIGSPMSTPTEISVGYDPLLVHEYKDKSEEFETLKKEYDKVNIATETLNAQSEQGGLDDTHKQILIKLLRTKIHLSDKLSHLKNALNDLRPMMDSSHGAIKVNKKLYYGVKIMIGNAVMYIKNDLESCELKNIEGQIKVGSYY
ncbi:MAG: FapA family protein [Clostridiales bacterium]|jgi:uncharacterized protein (DUF342 family)|nr:FapA family protein [Clostridiales bacterium]